MSEEEKTCPTEPGLSSYGGFDPGLDWASVKEHPTQNWHVIGWMVCLALIVVIWIVTIKNTIGHLRNYYRPEVQRHELRVLLFPPFYSMLAWLSYLKFEYETTIMLFAALFEAFAVCNLFTCLEAYLQPYRDQAGDIKEACDTKIMFIYKYHISSRWGRHYRTITNFLVFQYPLWTIVQAIIAIIASLKGRYCAEVYSFKGAYVYLVIINFVSLSAILTALFTYLDVFHHEWTEGKITAHGKFWCVKGPIMANFYLGEVLLTILSTMGVIHGTTGNEYPGAIAWPAAAVKNGILVIIYCVVMTISSFMMLRFFGNKRTEKDIEPGSEKMTVKQAMFDAYVSYIPEFINNVMGCGRDSMDLYKKRSELRMNKKNGTVAPDNTKSVYYDMTEVGKDPAVRHDSTIPNMPEPASSRDNPT